MTWTGLSLAVLLAYLCGSIPFGLILGRLHGIDLRKVGSGNIGATNCGRVLGRKWGLACFGLDLLKGVAPVLAGGWWLGAMGGRGAGAGLEWAWLGIAVATVLGHVFPVWLGFRGGKGVATGLGALLGVWPVLTYSALAAAGTWIVFAGTLRYVGLASVVAVIFLPLYAWVALSILGGPVESVTPYLVVTLAMAGLVIVRHRGNLARTWRGTELRLGGRWEGRAAETPKNFA